MANKTACFFLVPTWDFPPPPAGAIQLGNVLTSVKSPERALFKAPLTGDAGVFSSVQEKVEFSTDRLQAGRFGIFTRFLSLVLGIGIDAEVGWESKTISRFSFDSVETTQFIPEAEYVQSSIAADPVKRYLERSNYRKPVYIITGIKTVSGVKAETQRVRQRDASIGAETDASAWAGVPISGGPSIGVNKHSGRSVSWESPADFLFAYRVRKIKVERKTGIVRKDEDYKRGAFLENVVEKRPEPELTIVEEHSREDTIEGFSIEELVDDGKLVLCAIPNLNDGNTAGI